ncbi:hypothetical protein DFH06DRAFT_1175074 [Mycena polygramma]|nr:hypothetical protein DFH06DRAFT_1175074 [Mycena polygramma]
MAIPLPAFTNVVNLPAPPQHPQPDAHDVRSAHEYVKQVDIAWGTKTITDERHYEHLVVARYAGADAAPPWFAAALKDALKDALVDITKDLASIKDDIRDMKEDIRALKRDATKNRILAARSHNLACGDGQGRKFEPLPFSDGTEPPQDLPTLDTLRSIQELTAPQAKLYCKGYMPGTTGNRGTHIEAIRKFVGCSFV